MNHRILFPSIHGTAGKPFIAEVPAPTRELAIREVLEHCAAEGIALEYVQVTDIADLTAAKLDGLKLSNCLLRSVNLSGVALKGATVEHTTFEKVFADNRTCLDAALLENVRFVECVLNGMSAKGAQMSAIRFEFTSAVGVNVESVNFRGARQIRSDLSAWKAHMAYLSSFEGAESVIAAADLSENQKAAVRALALNGGNRMAAQTYLDDLESASANN
jgi:hypothetical protein